MLGGNTLKILNELINARDDDTSSTTIHACLITAIPVTP